MYIYMYVHVHVGYGDKYMYGHYKENMNIMQMWVHVEYLASGSKTT